METANWRVDVVDVLRVALVKCHQRPFGGPTEVEAK